MSVEAFGQPVGQSWTQIADFAIAFGLSALIGLEREIKQKAAGIRTYTVVGVGAALFMLVSKYGFTDVLQEGRVTLDPSRVAAQIVSGLGFIGGGIIFVRRDVVRGLTTAASIWLTAAVGAAAAGGLPILAVAGTGAYFIAILGLPVCSRFVARLVGTDRPVLQVSYLDGRGLLRDVLEAVTQAGFSVARITTTHQAHAREAGRPPDGQVGPPDRSVAVQILLDGRGNVDALATVISELPGVLNVHVGGEQED
ncbi:MAG TPA: MgtC/SapB family protein [Acidothermaceae bacterium]